MNSPASSAAALPAVAAPERIHRLLREELALLDTFLATLDREQQALVAGKVDQIPALTESKVKLATELARLGGLRERALRELGFGPGREGMESWLASVANSVANSVADSAVMSTAWQRLMQGADAARSRNDLNGRLIAVHLQHNQQALAALTQADNQLMTYGRDGQRHLGGGRRSFGSA